VRRGWKSWTVVAVRHVVVRAEFGVGDVENIGASGDALQCVPGVDVGARVAGIAVQAAECGRHAAVALGGEDARHGPYCKWGHMKGGREAESERVIDSKKTRNSGRQRDAAH
jgi:hypothetical protein